MCVFETLGAVLARLPIEIATPYRPSMLLDHFLIFGGLDDVTLCAQRLPVRGVPEIIAYFCRHDVVNNLGQRISSLSAASGAEDMLALSEKYLAHASPACSVVFGAAAIILCLEARLLRSRVCVLCLSS